MNQSRKMGNCSRFRPSNLSLLHSFSALANAARHRYTLGTTFVRAPLYRIRSGNPRPGRSAMGELKKPVGKVFRRLRFQRFVTALVWTLAASLLLVAIVLGTTRAMGRTIPGPEWVPFAIAGGCGVLIAALVASLGGASRLDAAVAIDHKFHL